MFSVIPNRKNYCLYFTVCAHYPRLPNVFSSNVRSSKYLIITELICSKALKPELPNARIAQMPKLPKAPKGLNVRIAQSPERPKCPNCPMFNCPMFKAPKCSKSPVPCKNSKFKNSKLRQSRNNSKFKIQNSKFTTSPSPPRQCFCRTVRYVRASAYTWRQQTCPPLLCSRPVSGSRGSRPSRCRRSL